MEVVPIQQSKCNADHTSERRIRLEKTLFCFSHKRECKRFDIPARAEIYGCGFVPAREWWMIAVLHEIGINPLPLLQT